MNKPGPSVPRPLAEVLRKTLGEAFAKKGFASIELVTRWREIVGPEIALHSQPEKIQWPRTPVERESRQPGTLWLKVEGPAAIEIQHLAGVIAARVNQFFGWQAVDQVRLRQGPLARPTKRTALPPPDPATMARLAATMPKIEDAKLREALARLGAALERHQNNGDQ